MSKSTKKHNYDQSVFYKLGSKAKLSSILSIRKEKLIEISKNPKSYYRFFEVEGRSIQEPKQALMSIHRRILSLLSRIQTPPYLHSAIKNRSYQSNALHHQKMAGKPCVKIDIKAFYSNVKWYRVYGFFKNILYCEEDISKILADITTVDNHLPTGSCSSPLLSFFSNVKMFDSIEELAVSKGILMSLYVDDLTFTGSRADERMLSSVNRLLHENGYTGHKKKRYTSHTSPLITGLILKSNGTLELPYARRENIARNIERLKKSTDGETRLKLLRCVVGQLQEACKFEKAYLPLRDKLLLQLINL